MIIATLQFDTYPHLAYFLSSITIPITATLHTASIITLSFPLTTQSPEAIHKIAAATGAISIQFTQETLDGRQA